MSIVRAAAAMTCAVVLFGCDEAESGNLREIVQRDSAGVRIVETPGDVWGDAPSWTTSAEPLVSIGAVEGTPEYLFSRVRGVVTLSDGTVVVSDGGSNLLRWYDATGNHLFDRGGSGEGPGEFGRIGPVMLTAGDTLVVNDPGLRRLTELTPDGQFVRTIPVEGITVPGTAHPLSDGTFIVGSTGFSSTQLTGEETGMYRTDEPLVRIGEGLQAPDTLGMFPGPEIYFRDRSFGFHPFSRTFHYAAQGDLVFVAANEGFVVDVYSVDGTLVRSIRAPQVDLRLTPETIAEYERGVREAAAEMDDERSEAALQQLADMFFPAQRPAYGRFLASDGLLMLEEHRAGRVSGTRRWAIFGPEGEYRGIATLPDSFRLHSVQGDRLLGTWVDDLGVEFVRIYRLVAAER